jgi:hypothetical protein
MTAKITGEMPMEPDFAFYCPRCQHGRCHSGRATLTRVHQGMMISAPDTPAYICDMCGYTEFERQAVLRLNHLLGYDAGTRETESGKHATYPLDEPNEQNDAQHPKT